MPTADSTIANANAPSYTISPFRPIRPVPVIPGPAITVPIARPAGGILSSAVNNAATTALVNVAKEVGFLVLLTAPAWGAWLYTRKAKR